MEILVTGGTGFIGAWLVKDLALKGHSVRVLVRDPSKAGFLSGDGVTLVRGDVTNIASLLDATKGVEVVYHLAAFVKAWSRQKNLYWDINTMGTQHLLDACLKNKINKVVITSSAGNFGPSVTGIVTEKTQRMLPFFTDYERSKNDADLVAMEYVDRGLTAVLVYPTRVFGPQLHGHYFGINSLIEKISRHNFKLVPGSGKSIGNYAYVHDVVKGIIQAMEYGESGESYLLGGTNKTYDEFYGGVMQNSGKETVLKHVPEWMLNGLLQLESAKSFFGLTPILGKDWLAKVTYNWEVSSAKAINELRYKITDFDEALRTTIGSVITDKKHA